MKNSPYSPQQECLYAEAIYIEYGWVFTRQCEGAMHGWRWTEKVLYGSTYRTDMLGYTSMLQGLKKIHPDYLAVILHKSGPAIVQIRDTQTTYCMQESDPTRTLHLVL